MAPEKRFWLLKLLRNCIVYSGQNGGAQKVESNSLFMYFFLENKAQWLKLEHTKASLAISKDSQQVSILFTFLNQTGDPIIIYLFPISITFFFLLVRLYLLFLCAHKSRWHALSKPKFNTHNQNSRACTNQSPLQDMPQLNRGATVSFVLGSDLPQLSQVSGSE